MDNATVIGFARSDYRGGKMSLFRNNLSSMAGFDVYPAGLIRSGRCLVSAAPPTGGKVAPPQQGFRRRPKTPGATPWHDQPAKPASRQTIETFRRAGFTTVGSAHKAGSFLGSGSALISRRLNGDLV